MKRCWIHVGLISNVILGTGYAWAAAVEGPASALLPPAEAGADLAPAVPPTTEPSARSATPQHQAGSNAPSGVTFERLNETLRIVVRMVGAAAAKLSQTENEVLVSFPRELPAFNTRALLNQANGLLTGLSVGFDTLLLQLAPGFDVARSDGPNSLRLSVQRGAAMTTETGPDEGELRLRLLEAQLLAQTGDLAGARERLEALVPQMPDSAEPRTALGNIDQQEGRWRLALSDYRDAERLDPGNPAIEDAMATINRAQGSRVRTDIEYRQTDGGLSAGRATAVIEGLSGHQIFGDGWRIGFSADTTQVDAHLVQRLNGSISSFSGTRGRTELYLQHDSLGGSAIGGSVYSNGDTVGMGAHAELPDSSGMMLLRVEYRRPDWDFFESIINQGTRDRVALGRRQQFGHDLSGRLEVAFNRYNVAGQSDVDRSATVTGELRLANLVGVRGLSAAYVIDAEYLMRRTKRVAADGTVFSPLDLVDREVHALTVAYAGSLGSSATGLFTYEASGGYGADRYGKAGPLLGAVLGYSAGSFDARLRASYVENIGRSRGMTQTYGATLAWIF